MTKLKIYIAGAFDSKKNIDYIAKLLQMAGFDVISTWHKQGEDSRKMEDIAPLELEEIAAKDCGQIRDCDILLCVTMEHSTTGGMYWESGFATALNKEVFYWGKITNIFTADRNRYDYLDFYGHGFTKMIDAMRGVVCDG